MINFKDKLDGFKGKLYINLEKDVHKLIKKHGEEMVINFFLYKYLINSHKEDSKN